jgi:cytidylate kinase
MKANISLERCISFINCHVGGAGKGSYLGEVPPPRWFVTLSRQGGCNAHGIAEQLAALLEGREPDKSRQWAVFDRELVKKVLDDHHLPQRLREFMPEDRHSDIADILEELCELHPATESLVRQTIDTVLRLAELGGCILIGRAANLVTRKLRNGFHVRLIGTFEKRVERMMEYEKLDHAAAQARVRDQDKARARFVKKYLQVDVEAAENYHLVINTDHFSAPQSAHLIAEGLSQLAPKR